MELDSKKIDVVWNGMTLTDETTGEKFKGQRCV